MKWKTRRSGATEKSLVEYDSLPSDWFSIFAWIVMAWRGMKDNKGWQTVLWAGLITNLGEALAVVMALVLAWSKLDTP